QHVGVVVLPRVGGGVQVVTKRGADAFHLVGCHARPDPRTIYHDPELTVLATDGLGHEECLVRVVDRFRGVRTEINHLVVFIGQKFLEVFLEGETPVVAPDSDLHMPSSMVSVPRSAQPPIREGFWTSSTSE